MAAVPGHGHPIGALCILNCDITESAKSPPEKQIRSHWAVETLCIDTIILCNKMDFSFGANMAGFCRASHIFLVCYAHAVYYKAVTHFPKIS